MGKRTSRYLAGACLALAISSAFAQTPANTASRLIEGPTLPLRTVPLPMWVQRGEGAPTPLPVVPSLMPGDRLIIRRPLELKTDMTVMAAALSAQSSFRPVDRFWADGRRPRPQDDLVLTIPDQPSVVVVMVSLHSTPSTEGALRRTLSEQSERLVESASVFAINNDQRGRWDMFFDALQTMPTQREAITNYNDYARRIAKDIGLRLPPEMDFNDSQSVRAGVIRAAEALETMRNAKPEDLQRVHAGLIAPLLPGPVRDYIDVAYALYKLAFRPRSNVRLVFAPSAAVLASRLTGETHLISSRGFPSSGGERTVAYMVVPVGREMVTRPLRPSVTRQVITDERVAVRIEEATTPPPGVPTLVGSPFLWNWRVHLGDQIIPAQFEPGQGVVARLPSSFIAEGEPQTARILVQFGADEWELSQTVRLVPGKPVEWSLVGEDRTRFVSGDTVTVRLTTPPTEAVTTADIEAVTFVSASGQRLNARSFAYEPVTGRLTAQIALTDATPGNGRLEVKLRYLSEPFVTDGLRCFAAMPGLAAQAARVGDLRLVIEQDQSNRVRAFRMGSPEWLTSLGLDGQSRTVLTLAEPLGPNMRSVTVRLDDGRILELPIGLRPALPSFLATAMIGSQEIPIGQGAVLMLPTSLLVADSGWRLEIAAQGAYALATGSTFQLGVKPISAGPEATLLQASVPRGFPVLDDAAAPPRWIIQASLRALVPADASLDSGHLMVRLSDGPDLQSAWTPVLIDGQPSTLIRTPTLRSVIRTETQTTLDFAANSGVLGVSLEKDGPAIAPMFLAGSLRVTLDGQPERVVLRLAGVRDRLELRLPPKT